MELAFQSIYSSPRQTRLTTLSRQHEMAQAIELAPKADKKDETINVREATYFLTEFRVGSL